jgi:D-glucosaminate-specific PTS system IID component
MLLLPVIQIAIGLNLSVAGYRQGRSSIQNMLKSGRMQELITGASIMGLFMMGALSSTYVKLSTPLEWNFGHGNEPMVLQNIIDSIVPGLLPLAVVMAIYFWLGRKKQNIGLIAIVILAISLASAAIGLF